MSSPSVPLPFHSHAPPSAILLCFMSATPPHLWFFTQPLFSPSASSPPPTNTYLLKSLYVMCSTHLRALNHTHLRRSSIPAGSWSCGQ